MSWKGRLSEREEHPKFLHHCPRGPWYVHTDRPVQLHALLRPGRRGGSPDGRPGKTGDVRGEGRSDGEAAVMSPLILHLCLGFAGQEGEAMKLLLA